MNDETIRDYLIRSDMTEGQAEALSRIFAEMATKNDVRQLESRMRTELSVLRGDVRMDLARMNASMQEMRAELTWKMIAIVGFFATASALFNVLAG